MSTVGNIIKIPYHFFKHVRSSEHVHSIGHHEHPIISLNMSTEVDIMKTPCHFPKHIPSSKHHENTAIVSLNMSTVVDIMNTGYKVQFVEPCIFCVNNVQKE
uniref:Uncharacterized protein n=1 Tax=Cacopsylla melanoneura TaxID=428564 RepID=A0A8D8U0U6_9HEMI